MNMSLKMKVNSNEAKNLTMNKEIYLFEHWKSDMV